MPGDHAARAEKAKVSRAEQSAAKDALRVVAAQAKADAAAERKAAAEALKLVKAQATAEAAQARANAAAVKRSDAAAKKILRPRLLLRRLRLMPRQIRKSPGALKAVTAQPRVDVPTEKRGYHCSMRRRGYRRLQQRITGAPFLTGNDRVRSHCVTNFCLGIRIRIRIEIVSGPAASPCSVLFLTVVYNRCILKKE